MEPEPPTPTRRHARGVFTEAAEFVHHDVVSAARVTLLGHDRRDRARRALLGIGACWLAAIGAVFLPVLHFVLVPALVVAGPLVAVSQLRQRLTVLDIEGPCPACTAPLREPLNGDTRTPMSLRCGACRRSIDVRLPAHLV